MITAQHIEAAESLLGIAYTPAEREQMIGNLDGQIALAAARRKVSLANSRPMASRFDPRLPTTPVPAQQEPLRYGTDAPSSPDDEVDIAFAPMTHLAAWIASGALTSRRLTELISGASRSLTPSCCASRSWRRSALKEVESADALLRSGKRLGPLHGSTAH